MKHVVNIPQNKTNVHELTAAHIAKHLSLFVCSNYRIVRNFCWCKFLRKSVQTLQKKFSRFLFSRMWDSLSVDGHTPYANRHWTTKQRSKPVQQWPDLPFVWRLSKLRRYQDCRRRWETGALDSALLISTSTTSECLTDSLVFCIVAGWFFFTATI